MESGAGLALSGIEDGRDVIQASPDFLSHCDEPRTLAQLGLARAAAQAGDTTKSRKAYQDFFALWKDADGDLSALLAAKKEYEKMK